MDLKRAYREAVEECESEAAVSTKLANLRCANILLKRRSRLSPAPRCPCLPTFCHLACGHAEGGSPGRAADVFFETLQPLLVVLLAMMGDGGLEALTLICIMGAEKLPSDAICDHINAFLDRISCLFDETVCCHVAGHTAYALEWLRRPHYYFVRGAGACIGSTLITRATLNQAVAHMKAWTALARRVLCADFQTWISCACFQSLPCQNTKGNLSHLLVTRKL